MWIGSDPFLVELPFQNGKREDIRLITIDNKLNIVNKVYNKLDLLFAYKRDNKILLSNNGVVYLLKKFWKKGNHFYIYKLGQDIISEVQIKLNNRKIAALDYFFNFKETYESDFLAMILTKNLQFLTKN